MDDLWMALNDPEEEEQDIDASWIIPDDLEEENETDESWMILNDPDEEQEIAEMIAEMQMPPMPIRMHMELPKGIRFKPTDEELVNNYLRNKVLGNPLPCDIIMEFDIYCIEPWTLAAGTCFDGETELYFFTKRTLKYPNGNQPDRSAGFGFWRASGANKIVFAIDNTTVIGSKKSLVYYVKSPTDTTKTDWMMHDSTEWALCRLKCGRNQGKDLKEESRHYM